MDYYRRLGTYEESREKLREVNLDFFASLLPYCEEYNVNIAIENTYWSTETGIEKSYCSGAEDIAAKSDTQKMIERAKKLNCKKVQIVKFHLKPDMIEEAHKNGIRCNMFWSDDPEETLGFLKMGVDTILTNDYYRIAQVIKKFKTE